MRLGRDEEKMGRVEEVEEMAAAAAGGAMGSVAMARTRARRRQQRAVRISGRMAAAAAESCGLERRVKAKGGRRRRPEGLRVEESVVKENFFLKDQVIMR